MLKRCLLLTRRLLDVSESPLHVIASGPSERWRVAVPRRFDTMHRRSGRCAREGQFRCTRYMMSLDLTVHDGRAVSDVFGTLQSHHERRERRPQSSLHDVNRHDA